MLGSRQTYEREVWSFVPDFLPYNGYRMLLRAKFV